MLAPWDGKPVAATDAKKLRDELKRQPEPMQATYLGRRIDGILDFVLNRGSASDLDDQIRTLADNDAMAMEGSYSLLRFEPTKEQIDTTYDAIAPLYDDTFDDITVRRDELQWLRGNLAEIPRAHVLDLRED